MPFTMTHLLIADLILRDAPQIRKPGDFLLGAVAPDAVHCREGYHSDMKKASHLCVGDERWGRLTNNEQWRDNVLDFLRANYTGERADFIAGYCVHLLTDLQNNIQIWRQFYLENREALDQGLGSAYHRENYDLDYAQYMACRRREEIWALLEAAVPYDVPGAVTADEIRQMRRQILHRQYADRQAADVSRHRHATAERFRAFVEEEAAYIGNILRENTL